LSDESFYCPLCGNKVSTYADKCPFCSTKLERVLTRRELDKVIERRLMQRLESQRAAEDTLTKDLFRR
jgi:predicted DCC family thiol-disulfide oxidoreductase YuxK